MYHPAAQEKRCNIRPLQIDVARDIAALAELAKSWSELCSRTGELNFYLTPEWCECWVEAFLQPGELRLITLWDDNRLQAVIPLALRRRYGMRTLCFVGSEDSDYLGILAVPEHWQAAIDALLDFVQASRTEWDVVQLRDIDISTRDACLKYASPLLRARWRMSELCPYIPTMGSWSEFTAQRKERFRKLRQTVNKCYRSGNVQVVEAKSSNLNIDNIESYIDDIQRDSWKAAQGRLMFRQEKRLFWRICLARMLRLDRVRCFFLLQNGQPIAYSLGFLYGRKIYYYSTGYRDSARALSPGTVITQHMVEYAFKQDYREFDFMRGDESYKDLWTHEARHSYEIIFWKSRIRSLLTYMLCYALLWRMRGNPTARAAKIWLRTFRERLRLVFRRSDVMRNVDAS